MTSANGLRSAAQLGRTDYEGWAQRACLKAQGFTEDSFRDKPVIGVCNTWSQFVHCNAHLRDLAEDVKRGITRAGGFALEFPVMSLGEPFMKPTTMLYRNLMAMDIEESIRAYPMDAVVVLVGCDKTVAAGMLGMASADVPAILFSGGPQLSARWNGRSLGTCTDCWALGEERRLGNVDDRQWKELEGALIASAGHCSTMGTAATMACIAEAMGLSPLGSAAIPAPHAARRRAAEAAGARIVEMARSGPRPSQILTDAAFENAIRVLHAIGGSTNAVIHLLALAGRVGVDLRLSAFDSIGRETPRLVNLKPSGDYLMEDFYYAGGVPAVMHGLRERMKLDGAAVWTDEARRDLLAAQTTDSAVITTDDRPFGLEGTISVVQGNLSPLGAVIKHSAATPKLLNHRGPAVVFDGIRDLSERLNNPALAVTPDSVLVLRNVGPVGGPGMPEAGHIPIPDRLLRAGITDMLRISDARMSGTAYGTVVLHVSPESAVGGPLSLVEEGDMIELNHALRSLALLVDEAELRRRAGRQRPPSPTRGYPALYVERVLQAHLGCDFDFLRASVNGEPEESIDAQLGII